MGGSCDRYPIFDPPCSRLLSVLETESLLKNKQSAVDELIQVDPGFIRVANRTRSGCADKGVIVIYHPSEGDCDALNEILAREFSDIPYRVVND